MEMVLGLVKARLNRPPGDTALDAYFKKRIEGAAAKLKRTGISTRFRGRPPPETMRKEAKNT